MNSQDLLASINGELVKVEAALYGSLNTSQPLLKEASEHLIKAGGKRLRPAFVLLSGSFFTESLDSLIEMAVAMELVHMATLVHDDVIDNSSSRRGRETVKAKFGNRMSIYSGDYVLAKSLEMVSHYNRSDIVATMANASISICEGEIRQMETCFKIDQSFKDYFKRIQRKTALLISLSCEMGALLAGADTNKVNAVKLYGHYLGMAFQITDDILDFVADEVVLGKPTGSDIRQGIITLPALYALRCSAERNELGQILGSAEMVEKYADRGVEIVLNSGGIEYSYQIAQRYVTKAQNMLGNLPVSPARESMARIAEFICERNF
ncbi:MAG: polyprenyl synthetase family protein [Chitinophagales bacterium]